jgi:hypothetical protein
MTSSPAATVSLVPMARTRTVDSGAMTAMAPAAGKVSDLRTHGTLLHAAARRGSPRMISTGQCA